MAAVLMIGTLNRVMIVELGVPSWIVALMLALPLLRRRCARWSASAPTITARVLGWRRVPFIWFGTMAQFGGFAIMPFALLMLSGDTTGPLWVGDGAAALAFLLVGGGLHTVQTVGLALATDLAPERARPQSGGAAVRDAARRHGGERARVRRGAARFRRGPAHPGRAGRGRRHHRPQFDRAVEAGAAQHEAGRRPKRIGFFDGLGHVLHGRAHAPPSGRHALGTAGFSMQDILLEPYGGKILKLPVGATTALTAMLALGGGIGLMIAARRLNRGADPHRVAGFGALVGVIAFAFVMFAAPAESGEDFRHRRRPHRARRRSVRAWHADGLDGGGAAGGSRSRARRLGRSAGDGGGPRHRRSAASSTTRAARSPCNGAFGEALADPVTGFTLVYGHRNSAAAGHHHRDRPARAQTAATPPISRDLRSAFPTFGLNPGGLR